jgi:hypothetical protein
MVGFEIRSKVSEYVRLRLLALRKEHEPQHTDAALVSTRTRRGGGRAGVATWKEPQREREREREREA